MNTIKMSFAATIITVVYLVSLTNASHMAEVCQWQTFKARCADDEVIVMREARYGRMRVGKCLTRNYFIGCSADVTDYMHGRCSGRQHCKVPVPDPIMFASQPCPPDLVAYLEADYACVKVAKWNKDSCDQVMTAPSGLIAKPADSVEDIRKKHHCPRRIVAQPGQTINVYLSDFFDKYHKDNAKSTDSKPLRKCITYGHVAEEGTDVPAAICGGEFKKDQLVYRSRSNVIDITLTAPTSHSHHYLIKYEVVGCPILKAPQHGWIEMQKDTAIIRCNNSDQTAVEMICSGNQWVGQMQECSDPSLPQKMPMSGMPMTSLCTSTGLLVAICLGVALGVLVGISLIVFAATRFYSNSKKVDLPTNQQNLQSELYGTYYNSTPATQDIYVYNNAPVVDPTYVPVCAENGSKMLMQANPVHHHIVSPLYEAPQVHQVRVNLTNFNNYATTLDSCNTTRVSALTKALDV